MNLKSQPHTSRGNIVTRVARFYIEGFRSMTIGRTLWLIILVKLFIMFAILKLFFFPDMLGHLNSNDEKADHVRTQLLNK